MHCFLKTPCRWACFPIVLTICFLVLSRSVDRFEEETGNPPSQTRSVGYIARRCVGALARQVFAIVVSFRPFDAVHING